MKTTLLWISVLLGGAYSTLAQVATPVPAPAQAAKPSAAEQAIIDADQAFVAEYNKADAKALAARYTEDAEVVEADGSRYRGRDLIEQRMAETFAAEPGMKLAIAAESIQFLSPDVAKEEGRTTITPPKGAAETRRHTALLVRRDGRWLISSIREEPEPFLPPHERLKDLDWMLGEWVDQGSEAHVRVSCKWSDDGNFLERTLAVHLQGKPAQTIRQRIGWDPLAKQFRSWEFDSEGSFGEGRWSRDGDRWIVRHSHVRPEGAVTSATNILVRERRTW
ncbi:MAG: SgcJ/EcaC family oxidoreductase [Isosphaeraceae bacterium]